MHSPKYRRRVSTAQALTRTARRRPAGPSVKFARARLTRADARSRHGRDPRAQRRRRAYLLLRLVQPPAAVPAAAVGGHPFPVTADVLETRRARLLDFIDFQVHLAVFLVRDAFEHRAVARPVSGVHRSGACEGARAPIDSRSGAGAHGTHEGLLLALGLLHVCRHGVAGAEALAHSGSVWLAQRRSRGWRRSADATSTSTTSARQSLVLRADCRLAGEQAEHGVKRGANNASAAPDSSTPSQRSSRPRLLGQVHSPQQWRHPNNKRAKASARAA